MSMATITETCGCGATFTATAAYTELARTAAREWREGHRHAESVGICGDRPPPFLLGGVEIHRTHCELRAGHTGMHGNDRGETWGYAEPHDAQEGAQ